MTYWIISANSQMYDHTSSFEHFSFIDWRQGNIKYEIGDIIFIYSTKPIQMIQYKCVVEKINQYHPNIRDDRRYWKVNSEYEKSINGKFMRLKLIDQIYNPKLNLENLKNHGLSAAPQNSIRVNNNLLKYINSHFSDDFQTEIFPEMINDNESVFEGLKKSVLVNKYERSSIARQKCIEFHGLDCKVCGVNFTKLYGEIGKDFIHVHHLTPIHTIGIEYKIDYVKDLVPVCPNCHSMLHRKVNGNEPTISELKEMLRKAKIN